MKKRIMAISTILLILMIIGFTSAWFTDSKSRANEFKLGTVEVEVVEEGFDDLKGVEATTYSKNVQVRSIGSKRTYVRVRLVPQWSDPSLPVSNVELHLVNNGDWILHTDGYYYYNKYLKEGEITSFLLDSVTFTELGKEYEGAVFSLHVIAEGVQITHDGWKSVWGINELPAGIEKP